MRFNKKASLEIGVNTIVILVIAMMLLGLGIGFVKGIFGKANEIPGKIQLPDLGQQPSYGEPLVLDQKEFSVKKGDKKVLGLGIYNAWGYDKYFTVKTDGCIGPADQEPIVKILPQQIADGDAGGFEVFVNAQYDDSGTAKDMTPGSYICNLVVYQHDDLDNAKTHHSSGESKTSMQFTITVTG